MKFLLLPSKSLFSLFLVLLLSLTSGEKTTLANYLREKYDEMPDNGKFATGAIVGFGASRVAVKSAVTVVKVAGAAIIASEALKAAGLLDDLPEFSNEQTQKAGELKSRALKFVDDFRNTVHRRVNPDQLRRLMETDRMATIGVAAGAFLGFIL